MKTTSTKNQGWRRPQKEKEKKRRPQKKTEDDQKKIKNKKIGCDIIVN